jgi:hypothetical protein
MKKIIAIFSIIILFCLVGISFAIEKYQVITVADTAIGFSVPTGTISKAFCTLETAQIRFRFDGESPTSTVGHIMNAGEYLVLEQFQIGNFKAIRTGAVSGSLSCSFY